MGVRARGWPIYYKDILLVNDPDHHLGICSLWTERQIVKKLLAGSRFNLIGNLYSAQGINAMIRNIFANPAIRTIVLWGAEMSLSGHSLLMLIERGLDQERRIINGRGEIEQAIPKGAVDKFCRSIEVVDLRGRDKDVLVKTVKRLGKKKKKPFLAKPRTFAKSEPSFSVLPSEKVGFRVCSAKVAKTWLKLLNEIYKYGLPKHTRYSKDNEIREILNLTAVVTDEDPDNIYFPEYLPFSETELKAYYAELMTSRKIPGVAYNYGRRLRKELGVDQIAKMKELVKKRPASKKMAAFTVNVKRDWGEVHRGDTPCLTQILGSIYENKFYFTAHFRSQDMVHGWPRNAFSLRKLQQEITDSTGYILGPLTIITHSAHIYGDDFLLVEDLLMEHFERELGYTPIVHFEPDSRGNVVVEIVSRKEALVFGEFEKRYEGKSVPLAVAKSLKRLPKRGRNAGRLIRATLYAPDGGAALKIFEGRTAQEVSWQMTDWKYLCDPGHVMYIGLELQRAEEAIVRGGGYTQDPA
jgi:thymidylate synthase